MPHRHHDATVRQHQAHDPHQSLTGSEGPHHDAIVTTTAGANPQSLGVWKLATTGGRQRASVRAAPPPSPAVARIDKARHEAVGFRHGRHHHRRDRGGKGCGDRRVSRTASHHRVITTSSAPARRRPRSQRGSTADEQFRRYENFRWRLSLNFWGGCFAGSAPRHHQFEPNHVSTVRKPI